MSQKSSLPSSTTALSSPTTAVLPPKNELVSRGLFKRWEVQNYTNETNLSVPSSTTTDISIDALCRQDIYIYQCKNTHLQIPYKMKGIKLEKCEQCSLMINQGTVGTIELVNCNKISLTIAEPVAGLRIDECRDIILDISWTCRVGYIDDSADDIVTTTTTNSTSSSSTTSMNNNPVSPSSNSDPMDESPTEAIPAPSVITSTRKPGTGLVLISSGSHGIRILYPLNNNNNADSPKYEKLVPDTLCTVITEDHEEPETTIVDQTNARWGRNVVARVTYRPTAVNNPPTISHPEPSRDPPQL